MQGPGSLGLCNEQPYLDTREPDPLTFCNDQPWLYTREPDPPISSNNQLCLDTIEPDPLIFTDEHNYIQEHGAIVRELVTRRHECEHESRTEHAHRFDPDMLGPHTFTFTLRNDQPSPYEPRLHTREPDPPILRNAQPYLDTSEPDSLNSKNEHDHITRCGTLREGEEAIRLDLNASEPDPLNYNDQPSDEEPGTHNHSHKYEEIPHYNPTPPNKVGPTTLDTTTPPPP